MSRSYPIWNDVQACIYNSSKCWGAKDTCMVTVNVGSSAKHSDVLVTHVTTRRPHGPDHEVFIFGVSIGGVGELQEITRKYFNHRTKEFFDSDPLEVSNDETNEA